MAKYFPEEEEKEQSTPEEASADTEVVVEKKSGLLSKVLALLIGVVIGIAGTIGGVVGAGYYLLKQPVKKVVVTVDDYFDEDVYSIVFGEAGKDGYLSENYANKKIGVLLGDTGRALAALTNGKGTLSDLTAISPKLDSAIRDFLRIAYKNYGVDIDKDAFMATPISEMKDFLSDTIYDSPIGDILVHFTDLNSSPMLMALCYGEKGVDYTIDEETGEVVMLGDAQKRTLHDLKDHSDDLFNSIALAALIDIKHDDEIMMYLGYGKKDVHYSLNDSDEIIMLQKRIGISNGAAYNAYGEPMPGTLSGMTYTEGDTTYLLSNKVTDAYGNDVIVRTTDSPSDSNVYATMYYVTDNENNPIYYAHTTFGDLTDGDVISNLTSRLTIGEILDESTTNNNRFLKHVKNETIATLPQAIEKLTIQDVFADQIYQTHADGNFILDANGNKTLKGEWWYLLTVNGVEQSYKVTQMDQLIVNMRANIEKASLQKLKDDGMITMLSQDSLDQPLRPSVVGISLPVPAGKIKLGELTVLELLDYVDQCLAAIAEIP